MAPSVAALPAGAARAASPSGDELRRGLRRYLELHSERAFSLPQGFVVKIVEDPAEAEPLLRAFARDAPELLGLDTEWGPGASVALLQLASDGECLLLREPVLREPPAALRALLEDAAVLKCGVGIAQDLSLLEAQFGLASRGSVELQALASRHDRLERGLGLAAICRSVLGSALAKDNDIRCSDWSGPLGEEQVNYAACDAYVAVEIVRRLHDCHAQHDPPQCVLDWCQDLVDRKPSRRSQRELQQRHRLAAPGVPHAAGGGASSSSNGSLPKVPLRRSQLYGGCRMLAPDGTHLANVGRRKDAGRDFAQKHKAAASAAEREAMLSPHLSVWAALVTATIAKAPQRTAAILQAYLQANPSDLLVVARQVPYARVCKAWDKSKAKIEVAVNSEELCVPESYQPSGTEQLPGEPSKGIHEFRMKEILRLIIDVMTQAGGKLKIGTAPMGDLEREIQKILDAQSTA